MSTALQPWLTDTETSIMLNIFCPHCGEYREEEEFHARGQAHIARPLNPEECSDQEWGEYMFLP